MTARLLLRLLVVFGLAATCLVLFGAPAQACSCAVVGTDRLVGSADQVFSGTVVDSTRTGRGNVGEITYDVEVDRAFKGDVADTVQVATAASSATCGLEGIPDGDHYLFFGLTDATREGVVKASLCGGSAPLTDRVVKKVEAVAGPGTTPTGTLAGPQPSEGADPGDRGAGSSVEASSAAGGSSGDDGVAVWPFIGGVLVIALVAGTWTARRTS
ncbi:hypothetical protein ncot_00625 [Nocardioides sp. JQ2195]|uniref:hypothetical protein n=1 Tax=Nocardioides sp. JQ2195 TaxID=2592334 RepID=UPI00143EB2FB|nr:hypothetical protein [Nocardioides sp. JQ2195]QIX25255.1 hypothetical protein ncot_00625 [Nocardioides sp. JQ2195]